MLTKPSHRVFLPKIRQGPQLCRGFLEMCQDLAIISGPLIVVFDGGPYLEGFAPRMPNLETWENQ